MLHKFKINSTLVVLDTIEDSVSHSLNTLATANSLEDAFVQALSAIRKEQREVGDGSWRARSIQITEGEKLVAMASVENGKVNWLRSPTLGDVKKWSLEMSENLRKIEKDGLSDNEPSERRSAFRQCAALYALAKEKLMTLSFSRSTDEVYETLLAVQEKMAEKVADTVAEISPRTEIRMRGFDLFL